jgi:hypothetical protein
MQQRKPRQSAVQVRLEPPLSTDLENWRRAQVNIPHRSEAMRELLRRGLAADSTDRRPTKHPA